MPRIVFHAILALIFIQLIGSATEAAMTNCEASCYDGNVYLTIPSDIITPNKSSIDVLKSENDFSVTIFAVKVLATRNIMINVRITSDNQSSEGIEATVSAQLKPTYLRRQEKKPLVIFFNSTSVCVLFETECSIECSTIPILVSTLTGFFKTKSSISITDNIAFTNNKTDVYMSTEKCKHLLLTDENNVNALKNRLNSVLKSFNDVLKYFGLLSTDVYQTNNMTTTASMQATTMTKRTTTAEQKTTVKQTTSEEQTTTYGPVRNYYSSR